MISFCTSPYRRTEVAPESAGRAWMSGSCSAIPSSAARSRAASAGRRARTTVSRVGRENNASPSSRCVPGASSPSRSPTRTPGRPRSTAMLPAVSGAWSPGGRPTTSSAVIRPSTRAAVPSGSRRCSTTGRRGRTSPS